jgi:hypothetical protein
MLKITSKVMRYARIVHVIYERTAFGFGFGIDFSNHDI